jgi:hypothetical protein
MQHAATLRVATTSFKSVFFKPSDDKKGKIKLLKGDVWDFHSLVPNSDALFKEGQLLPSELVVRLETKLREDHKDFNLPIIRVGEFHEKPVSPLIFLCFLSVITLIFFIISCAALYFLKLELYLILWLMLIIAFIQFKDNYDTPDKQHRLINKYTNFF